MYLMPQGLTTPNKQLLAIFCFVVLLLLLWRLIRSKAKRRGLSYPPGPKPLPLIGNLRDLPRKDEVPVYAQWAKEYGDLVHINVLGRHILFVNSFRTAHELFEKRSANYSDRNALPMINDLMGWTFSFGHMPYGERWKTHRRMFHSQFQPSMAPQYWWIQRKEAYLFIRRLLHEPQAMMNHLRLNAASTIMKVTYGIDIAPKDDYYITIAEQALDGMAKAASPGAFLVDILPMLKYVPAWCPGAGFQRKARHWRKVTTEMKDAPFEAVTKALAQGTASPSFVSNLMNDLEQRPNLDEHIDTVRNCAGLAYAAGAESTVSALSAFILAMILYPEVQYKAQQEIDQVIGNSRLPDFDDRDSLPYIDAVVKEVLRWNPVAPLGLPHMATHDDEFHGYFIPAGTTVIGNTWTILHDPEIFPNPNSFSPDRFLSTSGSQSKFKTNRARLESIDPVTAAFGYGRRICPGRYMADAHLWIHIACMVAVFDMRSGFNEDGTPAKVEAAFDTGMISHPLPFKYSITPRSERTKALIEQTGLML